MADLANAKEVAAAFAQHYYNTFDTNRAMLGSLYVDVSILTFETETIMGKENILKKLTGLPFQQVKHVITTVDGHPTVDNGVIVHVVGQLKTDNDQPHCYSETFHLKNNGAWVVLNDIFRLSIHHG